MKVSSKFIIVATIGFILMLISISTPAWSVFLVRGTWSRAEILEILEGHSDEDGSSSSEESDEDLEDKVGKGRVGTNITTTKVEGLLSSQEKDTETSTKVIGLLKLESQRHHQSIFVRNRYHGIYIHHGLWYSIVCDVLTFDGRDDWKSCRYDSNKDDYDRFNRFIPAGETQTYFEATNQFMVLQFQIETTLSLISLVIAMVTLGTYQKGFLEKKVFLYLCCVLFFISGILFLIAAGKSFKRISETVTALGKISDKVQFEVEAPWSPIIGGIGATMVAGVALSLMLVVSGKHKKALAKTSKTTRKIYSVLKSKHDAEMDLIAQPSYISDVETEKKTNSHP